eukprot:Skav222673  [mRNA]  locus=scaffold997:682593:688001:- [translate_table: standard]
MAIGRVNLNFFVNRWVVAPFPTSVTNCRKVCAEFSSQLLWHDFTDLSVHRSRIPSRPWKASFGISGFEDEVAASSGSAGDVSVASGRHHHRPWSR